MAPAALDQPGYGPFPMTSNISRGMPTPTPGPSTTAYLGIGVGVGAAVLLAIIGVVLRILHIKLAHRKAMFELERGAVSPRRVRQDMSQRLVFGSRCHPSISEGGQRRTGPEPVARSLSQRLGQHGSQKRFKQLSAIVENPQYNVSDLTLNALERRDTLTGSPTVSPIGQAKTTDEHDIFTARGSPRASIVPSLAMPSPYVREGTMQTRSVSLGMMLHVNSEVAIVDNGQTPSSTNKRRRPQMHERSVSLGAPLSKPPSGPVPPLPVISPLRIDTSDVFRRGVCVSRMSSSSSTNSTGSSVLISSPILERKNADHPISSPTVEEVVDDNDGALGAVVEHQWMQSNLDASRTPIQTRNGRRPPRSSVQANVVRSSTDSALLTRVRGNSSSSVASNGSSNANRLSIPQFGTAERISVSRVSSSNSIPGSGVHKIVTPTKRGKRPSSVSHSGSPIERNRRGAPLRDISGNASHKKPLRRELSHSTIKSGRSSNGNPFQWDSQSPIQTPVKASAMKGSPNAKKGHRRQHCVRVSTLPPQVFGPASRSRSTSPGPNALMDGIKEERESEDFHRTIPSSLAHGVTRAPTALTLSMEHSKVQTLRASLTPSSPTLSTWNAFQQDQIFASNRGSWLNLSPTPSRSSFISIPKFPSPARLKSEPTISPIEFDMSPWLDAADEEKSSPTPEVEIPSSPPILPVKSVLRRMHDPAWTSFTWKPSPPSSGSRSKMEMYDPASPTVYRNGSDEVMEERSSKFLPFAVSNANDEEDEGEEQKLEVSPNSRPSSYLSPPAAWKDSPPCSPKTMPVTIRRVQDHEQREGDTITSQNASSIMARTSTSTPIRIRPLNFPGSKIPILAPPRQNQDDQDYSFPRWRPGHHSNDFDAEEDEEEIDLDLAPTPLRIPTRETARCAKQPSLSSIVQEPSSSPPPQPSPSPATRSPSPTMRNMKPQGPRTQPPSSTSVLKNAQALRRMNSSISISSSTSNCNRESRTYKRLGREPSVLLPWVGSRGGKQVDDEEKEEEWAGEDAMADVDERAPGDFEGPVQGFHSPSNKSLSSPYRQDVADNTNVWIAGERFWSRPRPKSQNSGFTSAKDSAYAHNTPLKRKSAEQHPKLLLSSPAGGAGVATPKSLYDSDGFLKA